MPLALSQGTFDGFVSSNESLVSAKLWDAGVKYSLADHQFVAEYIPMISQAFWDKLSPDQQKMMSDLWAQNIADLPRQHGRRRRPRRAARCEEHGIKFVDPTPEQIAADAQADAGGAGSGGQGHQDFARDGQADHGRSWHRQLSRGCVGLDVSATLWDRIEQTLVGLLGLIALVIGLLAGGRAAISIRRTRISYAEEVIVYLVIWAVMIVSSQLVRRDGHVRPDLVLRLLPPRCLRWVEVFNCLVAIVFCGGAGLVRLADRRHLAADRRDAAPPTCSSRCGSIISRCRSAAR